MTTIFALSTPWGRSGVAVIRLSGEGARSTLLALTGKPLPPPRRMTRRRISDDGIPIDDALVTWFPGPQSFTGEDSVELALHGGPAIIEAALRALSKRPQHRLAEPGEFSKRAFHNGKLDLVEIEGVADLLAAETEAQRLQALNQASGETSRHYERWRKELVRLMAQQEAAIDFSDEDLPPEIEKGVKADTQTLREEMRRFLDDGKRGERLRLGLKVTLLGAPNVGKSSLINKLSGRSAAIVTPHAGTTRDVVTLHLDLGGFPIILSDTAGLRQTKDEIEQEGIRRALAAAKEADVVILIFDATEPPPLNSDIMDLVDARSLLVLNKIDAAGRSIEKAMGDKKIDRRDIIPVSPMTGVGLDRLIDRLIERAGAIMPKGEGPIVTRERHRTALETAIEALSQALLAPQTELAAEDLRLAARSLERLIGRIDVEDVLDGLFREFCIGK